MSGHVGSLTFTERAPGIRVYTLTGADGAEVGTYEAQHTDRGWHVFHLPEMTYLGIEPDGPEVAMRITLHAMPGPQR